MIYIAVCDDETEISNKIGKMISDFFDRKNMEVMILQFSSGEEILHYKKRIDILFLDILMDKMDGMETARRLRKQEFRGYLIFITILKEMVFQAFEVQAYDYLIKPIEAVYFEKIMERLFASIQNLNRANLLVQRGKEYSIVAFDEIIFCEIINRKVYLHLKSSEVVDYYERIEDLERKLDGRFYKCHRSYLINLRYLKGYKDKTAYMINGIQIPVSRLRRKAFSEVMLQYMKEWRG